MRVLACQLDSVWEDKAANHRKVEALLEGRRDLAGALIVLPEMFAVGFSMNVAAIQEGAARETERFLAGLAARHGAGVLGGVVTAAADGRGRNQAVAFAPDGREFARFGKVHSFLLDEPKHYQEGGALALFAWGGLLVAPAICYDLRFPELFREAARRGAELFAVIASWPSEREEHWVTLLRARAIENQAYVVGVNRCGRDPRRAYPGRSLIVDARGQVLADAGRGESVVAAELDPEALRAWRREFPALADMRPPSFYADLG